MIGFQGIEFGVYDIVYLQNSDIFDLVARHEDMFFDKFVEMVLIFCFGLLDALLSLEENVDESVFLRACHFIVTHYSAELSLCKLNKIKWPKKDTSQIAYCGNNNR